jgi:hypothetical protein
MKVRNKFCLSVAVLLLSFPAGGALAQEWTHGSGRQDGTVVPGHPVPDGNPFNNYSAKGNVNPGTHDPYETPGFGLVPDRSIYGGR